MKTRTAPLFGLIALLLFASCKKEEAPEVKPETNQAAPKTTEVEVPATEEKLTLNLTAASIADNAAIAELEKAISEKLGRSFEVSISADVAGVVESLRNNEANLARLPAWPYLAAHHRADMSVFAVEVVNGKSSQDSLWVVRADEKAKSLVDLKSKAIGFTTNTSAAGYLFASAALFDAKVLTLDDDPMKIFKDVQFTGGERTSVDRLIAGDLDAVALSQDGFEKLDEATRAKLKILNTQGPVPRASFSMKSMMSPEDKESIKKAFLELDPALIKRAFGVDGLSAVEEFEYSGAMEKVVQTVAADLPL